MTLTAKDPEQVRVVAPSTLNAGYTFQVELDGRALTVKVPEGGVVEGQQFDAEVVTSDAPATNPDFVAAAAAADPEIAVTAAVPVALPAVTGGPTITKTVVHNPDGTQTVSEETRYPDGRITTTTTTLASPGTQTQTALTAEAGKSEFTVPTGKWRYDIFSCCDTCSSGMFWMTWCLHYIAVGQLLQRMKLNFLGSESSESSYKHTCVIWTVVAAFTWTIGLIFSGISEGYSIVILYIFAGFLALVALTQARFHMRQKYSIPADCCADSGCLSDCCCMYWCSCCGVIQMMRHTHDEKKYVYNCTSQTGLHSDAPEIV